MQSNGPHSYFHTRNTNDVNDFWPCRIFYFPLHNLFGCFSPTGNWNLDWLAIKHLPLEKDRIEGDQSEKRINCT